MLGHTGPKFAGAALNVGVGLTVTVNVWAVPVQPLAEGVTVTVATTGFVVAFSATNGAMLPEPLAPSPMVGRLFVQLNVEPVVLVKFNAAVDAPLHAVMPAGKTSAGTGSTVMVNVCAAPLQPVAATTGVTVTFELSMLVPAFVVVNDGILVTPDAEAPRPVSVDPLFTQLYAVPATGPVKFTAAAATPVHSTWLATAFTDGFGLTVTVKPDGAPVQPPAEGITVTVPADADVPLFAAVKDAMLPVPVEARPTEELLFVQAKVVPATPPAMVSAAVAAPAHTACVPGVMEVTVGVGFTVTANVCVAPAQPLAEGVTMMVPDIAEVPPLAAVKEAMLPAVGPAPRPISVLLLVQL
jgi:hypothetical protein